MGLIKGLTSAEEILLILGGLFFIILATILVIKLIKNQPVTGIVIFMMIAVIMMAWSTIAKISYNSKTGEITVDTNKLLENPNDSNAKASLNANIEKIHSRANNDPNGLVIIANARLAMGDTTRTREAVDRAIVVNKKYMPALTLKKRLH